MTEREMKKLSRAELLELLLLQTKETERLQKKLKQAEAELAERQLKFQDAGTLAQAVIAVNGVMEAAQAAAQQYLDNIARMEEETRQRCDALLAQAQQNAGQSRKAVPQPAAEESSFLQDIYDLLDETPQNR